MKLKLVYRILRKISDWSIGGFYSEVYVEGYENVPRDGPLIIASTHHNEIIDIANLAATIPGRRHVSFWAKSSMFANPILRAILLSSGAIPVKRNPNNGNGNGNGASPQTNLFRESSMALAAGQVIGVFPEGTSYTQPSIMQVMSGVAWAAIDYVKWAHEHDIKSPPLTIVPLGIVYTDKAQYQSRVCVRYGKPINVDILTQDIFKEGADDEDSTKTAVKQITAEIEASMRALSINAPDWHTLHAAQMARDIIYEDPANIPARDWVSISQNLVDIFTAKQTTSPTLEAAKSALTKYYALLHYAGISHSSLAFFLPHHPSPLPGRVLDNVLYTPINIISLLLFFPPMLLHIPAYVLGYLASRTFVQQGEVEGEAQYKAIFGGVGLGAGLTIASSLFWRSLDSESLWRLVAGIARKEGMIGIIKCLVGALGVIYSSVHILAMWHKALVYGNYRRLKLLLTLYQLCLGLFPQRPASAGDLERYTHAPEPPPNPFIKKNQEQRGINSDAVDSTRISRGSRSIPRRKLIRPLLAARTEAVSSLKVYLKTRIIEDGEPNSFISSLIDHDMM